MGSGLFSGKNLIYIVFFVLSWSSGFIFARIGTGELSASGILFWRYLCVSLVISLYLNKNIAKIRLGDIIQNVKIGVLSQFAYLICLYTAIHDGLPSGTAAVIAASQPLMTAALSAVTGDERLDLKQWAGLVVGFLGVAIVIISNHGATGAAVPLYVYLLPAISALCLSISSLIQQKSRSGKAEGAEQKTTKNSENIFIQAISNLLLFTIFGLASNSIHLPQRQETWVSILSLTLFATFMAYLLFWMLIDRMGAVNVAKLVYLEPPVTIILSWMIFNDQIHPLTYIGFIIIVLGIRVSEKKAEIITREKYSHSSTD